MNAMPFIKTRANRKDNPHPPPVAELDDVHLALGEKKVLCGVSFDVPAKERLVILCQSGSGKSTILRLLLGILHPDAGSVKLKDGEISQMSRRDLNRARQKVGMV